MNRIWTFIKHKRSGIVGVLSLKKEGKLYSHPLDKAELLNLAVPDGLYQE